MAAARATFAHRSCDRRLCGRRPCRDGTASPTSRRPRRCVLAADATPAAENASPAGISGERDGVASSHPTASRARAPYVAVWIENRRTQGRARHALPGEGQRQVSARSHQMVARDQRQPLLGFLGHAAYGRPGAYIQPGTATGDQRGKPSGAAISLRSSSRSTASISNHVWESATPPAATIQPRRSCARPPSPTPAGSRHGLRPGT